MNGHVEWVGWLYDVVKRYRMWRQRETYKEDSCTVISQRAIVFSDVALFLRPAKAAPSRISKNGRQYDEDHEYEHWRNGLSLTILTRARNCVTEVRLNALAA